MINQENIICIEKLLNNKKIIYSKLLSDSFNINCFKFTTSDKQNYIVKYYKNTTETFNAIEAERRNLKFIMKLNIKLFPKVCVDNGDYLIISYIENNDNKPNETKSDLLEGILLLHSFTENKYGFEFDTQIGGLKQINKISYNWVDFFREFRLGYIYEIINSSNKMEAEINIKIEFLLNKLNEFLPKNPKPSLLHGDLWEGNILFNNSKFVGFIDPGSFYGHNELEIAYLRWFNPIFIDNKFLDKNNETIKINDEYLNYEPIYQLYYSLLNVYLWDRSYIGDVKRLLDKIKI